MRKKGELIDLWVVTSVKSAWKAAREAKRSPCWFFSRPSRLGRAFCIKRDWHKQRNNHVGIIRDWHKQRYNEVPCLLHHKRLAQTKGYYDVWPYSMQVRRSQCWQLKGKGLMRLTPKEGMGFDRSIGRKWQCIIPGVSNLHKAWVLDNLGG